MKEHHSVECSCPRCRGVATADPKWGFDTTLVPSVHCLVCDQPIGQLPYRLDTSLERFGQMLFVHEKCPLAERRQSR